MQVSLPDTKLEAILGAMQKWTPEVRDTRSRAARRVTTRLCYLADKLYHGIWSALLRIRQPPRVLA